MSDGYKNILANGYMRDTNYIIIKDCDNIDELNIQWNKFLSNMTVRQQRLSDDKSIEIWNITNQQHYKIQKQQFLEKLKKKDIEGNKEVIPSNIVDLNDDTPDSIFASGDFDEFKNDIDISDPKYYTEDNNINLTLPDDIKDDPNDNAMEFNQDSTMSIVGNIAGNNVEDKLKNLEKEFIKFNSQSNDIKRKADDKCRELYGGSSNLDRYNKLKSEYLSNKTKDDLEPKDFIPSIEPQDNSDNDEIKCNEKICRCHYNDSSAVTEALHNDSFIARCYSAYILNSINEASDHKEMKRLEDVPYFTPQELIDLGVHGNNNYYSKMSDNDGLTKDISISTWFDSYKDLSMNHIFEDYRKEWINKLNELYSDYYDIRDEDKLLARKQSILDLGWNPEIPFTNENRIKASNRVNEILKQTITNDIFIDMSNVPESDDYLSESIDTSYEPVFLVLTKGKTPVISQGIKFVTNSEYSHASITFDPELEEVYSFNMRKESFGFVRENKSSFKDNFISVFAFFAPKNIVNKLKETVYDFANHKTTFDLRIFANKIFHINHKASNNEYNQVCSTFVDTVLQSGGINLVGDQKIPAPSDIYNGAKSEPNKIFEVYNGIAPKYDGKKVKRQINYLRTNQDTLSINETMLENIQDIKNGVNPFSNKKFYHISFDENLDGKILQPRIPSWIRREIDKNPEFTKELDKLKGNIKDNGSGYEEYNTPRVCFSNSIEGCLNAIITSKDRLSLSGEQIHVYIPEKKITEYKIKSNKSIKKDGDIFDANITNEMWILEPVKVKYIGSIIVDKVITEKKKKFANNKYKTIIKYIYKWHWFHKIKFNESFSYINESNDRSKFEKDYISKNKLDLNSFKKVRFKDNKNISEYISNNKFLSSKKGQDLINKYADGYIWIDEDNKKIVGYVAVDYKWKSICPIEICPKYRNHGLSKPIMKIAIDELGAEWLYVYTDNEVAINLYKNLGFKITGKYGKKYAMALPKTESYDKMITSNESFSYINEVKKFPIEFDDNGNLTIYKCRMGNISYGDEIDDSSELLESYRKLKKDYKILTKDLFPDKDNEDEYEKPIKEEKIETFISTNPFENSIVLYHGSPISNLKKIKPVSLNNGTRFSSMRKSSFWTKNIKYAIFIDILRLVQELEIGQCEHMMDNCITVITKDNITSDDIIKKIINKKIYVYEKEIPKKYIGRGHCARQDEYSIDVDVIPSKIHEYNVSEVINDINIQVLTLGTEEEKEYTNKKNDFWNNKKSLINHIVYRDRDDYLKIKSKYKKDLKESFSFVNESIKDSEEESKKSVNESSDIYYISEGDDIMVKYIYESNDRSKFEKDYISKNKLDLNSFKKVRFKDSKNISEYINNNKFLSSKKGQDLINKYADGYIWIDEDNKEIVGYVAVDYKWKSICPIELYPKYRNHGLSKPIMKIAINELGAEWLYVYTDNEVAINLYKTLGFKITGKYGKKYAMALPGTESYDKMMPVKEEYDTLNIIEESVNSDIYLNIEDLESGKSNVLLVTGYSGSGKSTLSHKLSKDHGYIEAPLDDFDERLVGAAELTEFPIIEEYFKSHKVLDIDYKKEDPYTNKDFIRAHDEFIKWCITKSSPNRKIIIEGIQIYLFVSSDLVKKYPIIIKGTSFSKSMKRRIIRNIKAIDDPKDKFIHFFKTIKNLSNHTGDIKTLRDFKKSVNESFSYINEDYTFVKDKNKDNLYLKGKELYDSLSKHDKEFLGGHYIDSKNIYYRKIYTSGKDITGFGELYIFDSSPNDAVLMYAVSPDYRNKGLSNKILNDIFDFCKKDKNIHSIIWRANKNNDASNYLANKYKMKLIHSDDRDNEYSMVFNESFSYINEVKKFPIEFDDNGNLTIYKCRMGNISYGDEIDDSSELLESYRNTNNIEGMKYEVSRLWFIISDIEKKMTKRIDSKKYDEYVRNRATATNIFKHNLEYLMKMDKDFNFAEYYNTTPFSNNSVKITNNTLKYSMKTLQQFIMK